MWYARTIRSAVAASVLIVAAACAGPGGPAPLRFLERDVARSADGCRAGDPDCAWVRIAWLEAEGGTDAARVAIQDWIRGHILEPLGDHWTVADAEDVAAAFLSDRAEFVNEFPDAATAGWYLERGIRRLDAPEGIVSLEFTERQYTGGAHGMEGVRLVSFDARSGAILGLTDLVPASRIASFRASADRAFRADRELPPDRDLRDAGFYVEDDVLPPTDNVARVATGIRMRFDAYEIAPYAMGPTDFVVPLEP